MGQGGKITLVNSTPYNWTRTHQHSYQMHSWNFPSTIPAKTSVSVYVEWDQNIFHQQKDDAGEIDYTLDGTGKVFQIQARAQSGFDLKIYFRDLETQSIRKGTTISLGWEHDGYVSFVLAGSVGHFISTGTDASSWMQNNLSTIGNRTLKEICIPGSHDSGMSEYNKGTAFAHDCNVLTQGKSIGDQLAFGTRYFDIRPTISAGNYLTGHYSRVDQISSWQGANGQSVDSIINDVNNFSQRHQELVVLNISHSLNTDLGNNSYRSFNQSEWDGLFFKLSHLQNLYQAPLGTDLTSIKIENLISGKSAVIVIIEDPADLKDYAGNGFFKYDSFKAYNSYASKNDVGEMAQNQFKKMKEHHGEYFLLSWTLTQDGKQASTCVTKLASSIISLAKKANQRMADLIFPEVHKSAFPNILYTDYIVNSDAAVLAMAINTK